MTVQPTRDQLRALAAAATPGPWVAGEPMGWGDNDDEPQSGIDTPTGVLTWDDHGGEVFKPSDAEVIAAARNTLPALLDALDQAEARIRDLTQEARDERAACLDQIEQVKIRDARIKAVQDVLDRARDDFEQPNEAAIRRALEG